MEIINLYKVRKPMWNRPDYVAAKNQQEAIDKAKERYVDEHNWEDASIEYVAEIIV